MKQLLALTALVCSGAWAGPCVSLDYQEMKEMPFADLKTEFCKAENEWIKNLEQAIENIGQRRSSKPDAQNQLEQCKSQRDRMERVLRQRDATQSLACG